MGSFDTALSGSASFLKSETRRSLRKPEAGHAYTIPTYFEVLILFLTHIHGKGKFQYPCTMPAGMGFVDFADFVNR